MDVGELVDAVHDRQANDLLFSGVKSDQVDKITESEVPPDPLFIANVNLSDPMAT